MTLEESWRTRVRTDSDSKNRVLAFYAVFIIVLEVVVGAHSEGSRLFLDPICWDNRRCEECYRSR